MFFFYLLFLDGVQLDESVLHVKGVVPCPCR